MMDPNVYNVNPPGIVEKKKRIIACNECKRRKAKCHGGYPCAWCVGNSLECVVNANTQPRNDHTQKKRVRTEENTLVSTSSGAYPVVDSREQGMFTTVEMTHYMELYLKCIDPLFTMLSQWDKGTRLVYFIQPRTDAQFVSKYSACALVARACGQKARANQFAAQARILATKCFDEFSIDSLLAFLMLGACWVGDLKLCCHYGTLATSIFSALNPNIVPSHIRFYINISKIMANTSLPDSKKRQKFVELTNSLVATTLVQRALATILRVKIKIFSHLKCIDISAVGVDVVSMFGSHVSFSEEQRVFFLQDLELCRQIASSPEVTSDERTHTTITCLLKFYEVYVEWKSGHIDNAMRTALELVSMVDFDILKFGSLPIRCRGDSENLLMVSMFLYEQQRFAEAQKMHLLAQSLYDLLEETPMDLLATRNAITTFIQKEYYDSAENQPRVPVEYISVVATKMISELTQLPPNTLLSPKGLHACTSALSFYYPPVVSPFEVPDEPPVATAAPLTFNASYNTINPSLSTLHTVPSPTPPPNNAVPIYSPAVFEISPSGYYTSPNGSENNSPYSSPPTAFTFLSASDSTPPITPSLPEISPSLSPQSSSSSLTPPTLSPSSLSPPPLPIFSDLSSATTIEPAYFAINTDETLPSELTNTVKFEWLNVVDWNIGV